MGVGLESLGLVDGVGRHAGLGTAACPWHMIGAL